MRAKISINIPLVKEGNGVPGSSYRGCSLSREFRFFLKYIAIGIVNTVVGIGIIFMLLFLGVNEYVSNAAGYGAGICVSYFLNRTYNFRCTRPVTKTFPKFIGVVAVAYAVNLMVLWSGLNWLHINRYLAQLLAVGSYTLISFAGHRWKTFEAAS